MNQVGSRSRKGRKFISVFHRHHRQSKGRVRHRARRIRMLRGARIKQ